MSLNRELARFAAIKLMFASHIRRINGVCVLERNQLGFWRSLDVHQNYLNSDVTLPVVRSYF